MHFNQSHKVCLKIYAKEYVLNTSLIVMEKGVDVD